MPDASTQRNRLFAIPLTTTFKVYENCILRTAVHGDLGYS